MTPVQYGAVCLALVDAFNAREPAHKDHNYWNDPVINPVRAEIKDHYIAEQNRRCCYCNREYPTNNKAVWDGEHIIAKSLAPRFMFEPRNLAASCKDCNIAKGEDEVRVDPDRKSFPDQPQHYIIVHPHFDNYDDHIRWYGDAVKPLSPKGGELVGMCKLWRFGVAKAGVEVAPPNPLVDGLIGIMMDAQADPLTKAVAIEGYKEYVRARAQKPAA
ncbi:HNH endonuclease [Mesorhizobium sp. B261B1A]|uniref:HNH endonuclease n=1 Tax=Mesorhizobium sp. B261B1A TaxID=2876671 RepID=UPI001CD13E60|nr:HNH endonuclease [Mesorhizobium sp. B261B1A]MCA0057663.1 HNH endonuclease [Mesorhizobium sp. B261B1A]